ncbi:ATP-grasp domain-containing protein [Catenulispora sp. NL8]|uniref:ATP-grasp domain-containing protein n=1 Tax=Catenulispora pinistramenti TaxID=2705254 RepID=A0ABS5L0P2_9ACTN|nr:ATP-grasp domain-containing protein [Catenulispora pinistramenti]MBS2551900.1 ATP-grasp domain-containing protein [Catenulispora pinistramenti]
MTDSVLVTGAGGPAGVSVVNALLRAGIRTVAVDCDASAAGLTLGSASAVVPPARDPKFVDALCEIAVSQGADAIVSTVAEELLELGTRAEDLAGEGIAVWVPSRAAVGQCCDKAVFAAVLTEAGIATPATGFVASDVSGPWIVKPRFGRGSRDVYPCDSLDEVVWALRRVQEPIVQTRLSGREFTVDALVDRQGLFAGGVPRWRLETRGGISTKGETFADDRVLMGVAAVLDAVGLRGVACVQGFVTDEDEVVFVECNPRFSGGLPLSLAAGADLVGEYLRGVRGLPIRSSRLGYRPGVRMSRLFCEVFQG